MALKTYDDFVSRAAAGYWLSQPILDYVPVTTGGGNWTGTSSQMQRCGKSKALPTLPSGVTAYIASRLTFGSSSNVPYLFGKLVNLGSLTLGDGIGGASSFVDGVAMPTQNCLGVSKQLASMAIGEVTTALNSAPGTFTVSYKDQDGNSAETTAAITPVASAVVQSANIIALNSPDWGVTDITTASRSGGTNPSGVIKFWGILPLALLNLSNGAVNGVNLLTSKVNALRLGAGDVLGGFVFGSGSARAILGDIYIVGDN